MPEDCPSIIFPPPFLIGEIEDPDPQEDIRLAAGEKILPDSYFFS